METLLGDIGTYSLIRRIGKGGMCVVYSATDNFTGKNVAIKRLRADRITDNVRKQFIKEISIMERLTKNAVEGHSENTEDVSYTGIPRLLDVGEDFYVMEMINGVSLSKILAGKWISRSKCGDDTAINIMEGICKILIKLHEMNPPVIHLDLKPSNVIISSDNKPYLIDFGSAIELNGYGMENNGEGLPVSGTRSYAAPEQYGDIFVKNQRTDIFQFGKMIQVFVADTSISYFLKKELHKIAGTCARAKASERYNSVRDVLKDVVKSRKKAETSRYIFILKLALGAALFLLAVFFILHGVKSLVYATGSSLWELVKNEPSIWISVCILSFGHRIWNDEKMISTVRELCRMDRAADRNADNMGNNHFFIDIVMTCDTIDI